MSEVALLVADIIPVVPLNRTGVPSPNTVQPIRSASAWGLSAVSPSCQSLLRSSTGTVVAACRC